MKRLGIDVGGTFTDIVLVDDRTGGIWTTKVPTTRDPADGAIAGIERILELSGAAGGDIEFVGHGTTIATNMVIQGQGARTALLTTRGFRDILEIRRASRHDRADLYDLFFANPPDLVPRRWRREIGERVLFDGSIEAPLAPDEVRGEAAALAADGIEAIAICFINAPANPAHEQRAVAEIRRAFPALFASASCEVNPEILEYERTSTTVLNAMLGPRCGRYIGAVQQRARAIGLAPDINFMQSNGGLAKPAVAAARPVALLESGPAGGVTAAAKLCERLKLPNAITGDMGGTSFDVSLIRDFRPTVRSSGLLHSYAVRFPTIDIESIGAGGGSIAWIDEGGGVHIGPRSAGADPGPVCYGRGGTEPTVTDCNLILGHLAPDGFLGGAFTLDRDAAHRAVEARLARPLGKSVVEAAEIVRAVANALMAQAIRLMTVERGYDPRDFVYIPYGGAGPVHAMDLVRELEIPTVVVPPLPGLFSAFGMLVADLLHDLQAPILRNLDALDAGELAQKFGALETEARTLMRQAGVPDHDVALRRRADCRYLAQAESLSIELAAGPVTAASLARLEADFTAEHGRQWNFTQPDRPITLVNIRIQAVGKIGSGARAAGSAGRAPAAPIGERQVHLAGARRTIPCYARDQLAIGQAIAGPAVIQEHSSSIILDPGDQARLDGDLNIVIQAGGRA
jgi:N-methylhydantoinase A